jgi:hypothetical protein
MRKGEARALERPELDLRRSWLPSTAATAKPSASTARGPFRRRRTSLRLRAHDMRAFFVTSAIYAGKDALGITDRAGHTSLGMLRTYERDVRRWRELGEAPLDVAAAIPEVAAALAAADSKTTPESVPSLAAAPRKCTGRDLNPYAFRRRNLNPLRLPFRHPCR